MIHSTSKLDGGRDLQRFFDVRGSCTDDRTGIMDRDGGPCAEFLLRESEPVADGREDEQCDGVEHEYDREGHGHVRRLRLDDRTDCGDGTSTAYRSARTDKVRRLSVDLQ